VLTTVVSTSFVYSSSLKFWPKVGWNVGAGPRPGQAHGPASTDNGQSEIIFENRYMGVAESFVRFGGTDSVIPAEAGIQSFQSRVPRGTGPRLLPGRRLQHAIIFGKHYKPRRPITATVQTGVRLRKAFAGPQCPKEHFINPFWPRLVSTNL